MPLRPTRALIALLSLWTLMGLAGSLYPRVSGWWGVLGGALGLLGLFDALVVVVSKLPLAERTLPGRMAVGVEGGGETEDHKFKQSPSSCRCV